MNRLNWLNCWSFRSIPQKNPKKRYNICCLRKNFNDFPSPSTICREGKNLSLIENPKNKNINIEERFLWTPRLNRFFFSFFAIFFHSIDFVFFFVFPIIVHEPHYASYGHYDYDTYDNHYAYDPHSHAYSHY